MCREVDLNQLVKDYYIKASVYEARKTFTYSQSNLSFLCCQFLATRQIFKNLSEFF